MAEFCRVFNVSPAEYKALTMGEYMAFVRTTQKD